MIVFYARNKVQIVKNGNSRLQECLHCVFSSYGIAIACLKGSYRKQLINTVCFRQRSDNNSISLLSLLYLFSIQYLQYTVNALNFLDITVQYS